MFRVKVLISTFIFISFLLFTSVIKNKARILEKKISNIKSEIMFKKKNINEAQLDFFYLTSPKEIEKKLNIIGFNSYKPIVYSKIFLEISDLTNIQSKISNLKNINEKEIQKK